MIREINAAKIWPAPIVTEVRRCRRSTLRRTITRSILRAIPSQGYCTFVIAPKVAKFRKQYLNRLKK